MIWARNRIFQWFKWCKSHPKLRKKNKYSALIWWNSIEWFRLPFNYKTPLGYLMLTASISIASAVSMSCITPSVCFTVGAAWLCKVEIFKYSLKKKTRNIRQWICDFVLFFFHTRLSTIVTRIWSSISIKCAGNRAQIARRCGKFYAISSTISRKLNSWVQSDVIENSVCFHFLFHLRQVIKFNEIVELMVTMIFLWTLSTGKFKHEQCEKKHLTCSRMFSVCCSMLTLQFELVEFKMRASLLAQLILCIKHFFHVWNWFHIFIFGK